MPKNAPTWTCSRCGEVILNLPMLVLKHQLSHVERRLPASVAQLALSNVAHEMIMLHLRAVAAARGTGSSNGSSKPPAGHSGAMAW
jgi:hypothetical protein